ncbi:MAG: 16S rRNA (cytosine(967)-C(5))-methyltransferase RsmB [Eubacteriaceae bacterium]
MNTRELALKTLMKIDYEGAYSNLETKQTLTKNYLKNDDQRLYLNIVYGCLQNRLFLDYLIIQQSATPIKKINKEVLEILRMSIYQIYFLDKIPDYAIVNEGVKLTIQVLPKAKGFVNGVLRNVMRKIEAQGKSFNFEKWNNEKEALSIRYSVPLWIVYKYYETFGKEKAEKIIPTLNEKPPFTIRCNPLKTTTDELMLALENLGAEPVRGKLSKNAIHLNHVGVFNHRIEESELYKKGYFSMQDQGGMLTVETLNPLPKECILDMCAAPGGKTTYISQLMNNEGEVVGRDIFDQRLKLMENGNKRLGCENVCLEKQDGLISHKKDKERFDKILLDAPCTGLGVLRRKPEIRYMNAKEDRKALVKIQRQLLDTAFEALKQGGELVYSTCTVNQDENEHQIENFLKKYPEMTIIENDMKEKYRVTSPLDDGCDAFFFVHLKKN